MTDKLEGPAWDARREELETTIRHTLAERAKLQQWISPKGKLTAKGKDMALEFIIGVAQGMHMANDPASGWIINQAFLCSVRGVNERFPFL